MKIAHVLSMQAKVGVIRPGYEADLLVLELPGLCTATLVGPGST